MMKRNFEVDIQKKLWANNKVPYVINEASFGKILILNEFKINNQNKFTQASKGRLSVSNLKETKDIYILHKCSRFLKNH